MKRIFLIIGISIVTAAATITVYHVAFVSRLGYIQTGMVLQEYKGMQEAEKKYTQEMKTVRSNIDTLRSRYERMARDPKTNASEDQQRRKLQRAHEQWQTYSEKASSQMEQRRLEMNREVINDLNRITKAYGEANGYDIIFGATTSGSIMYGKEAKDITSKIIQLMNEHYQKNKREINDKSKTNDRQKIKS